MEVSRDEAASGGNPNSNVLNPNSNPNSVNPMREGEGSKGKSCKGCAYYSSLHKSKSINPTCVGFSTTLPQVPPYVVGETELKASKEGRTLTNFKYACIGYSLYLDNKDSSADMKEKTAKLPYCVGLEVVLEEKSSTSPVGHVPAHKTEEHEHATPQPRRYKPPSTIPEEFLNRQAEVLSLD
ncbi:hypothetical protein TanjilG_23452 [Lupinus angustifolius]|uniref:DUF8204 domain-containing protein n=1 Tax=Lupinus angustifolius TaxID=3871 RepID=A0A4P1R986_LUPAN|nr:hypothetical protein TanjilG_23452 [Lupinus angustifolius]